MITAADTAALFDSTAGLAPLFNPRDTGNRPDADLATLAGRRVAFQSTLLARGLIRFPRILPATSEFTVVAVDDPFGFATPSQLTSFRRPTPTPYFHDGQAPDIESVIEFYDDRFELGLGGSEREDLAAFLGAL